MKFSRTLIAAALAVVTAPTLAAVSAEEAKQIGTTLTAVGAEKAGNKDGTIPAYTGGLTTPPAGFQKGAAFRPDPFATDKPRVVISAKNMAEHADKLTPGTQELLRRYPSFRVDVYPTHRPVVLPKAVLDNTARNAVATKTVSDGLGMESYLPGVPFPIPKTGNEAMWNHLVRYQGAAFVAKYDTFNVDSAGVTTLAVSGEANYEWPIYDLKKITTVAKDSDPYWRVVLNYKAPARRAGEAMMALDSVNPSTSPRRAWLYLPGQRRVKVAPEVAYDTPNPGSVGMSNYDDANVFNGAMDRFDFKLVGKKEMYVPYNNYRLIYHKVAADIVKPQHPNPDFPRWELHRVWVVEATLKPGKRHVYSKRRIYIDEDSWTALAAENYDARGQIYRAAFNLTSFSYDVQGVFSDTQLFFDFVSGGYNLNGMMGPYGGIKYVEPKSDTQWSPETLSGSGVR